MSWLNLLTTNRSLTGIKAHPSPYRMAEPGLLPKFGGARGLERNEEQRHRRVEQASFLERLGGEAGGGAGQEPSVNREGEKVDAGGSDRRVVEQGMPASGELGGSQIVRGKVLPERPPRAESSQENGERLRRRHGWWRGWFGRGKSGSRNARSLVQGELGLESVRVVRNDLLDEEVCAVPVKAGKELREEAGRETGVAIWSRLSSRLFEKQSG